MALPSSGTITMAQVAAEIGISATGLSLNDSRVRQLAGKPSGAISFADLLGKAWAFLNLTGVSVTLREGPNKRRFNFADMTVGISTNTAWSMSATLLNHTDKLIVKQTGSNTFRVDHKYKPNTWYTVTATVRFTAVGGGITKTIDQSVELYRHPPPPPRLS